jgi:hypothetical protein
MKSRINQCARQMVRFLFQLGHGVMTSQAKTALAARKRDARAAREAHFAPFCQFTGASGTEWACDGNGYWELLKADGQPSHTAVAELFEAFGFPALVLGDLQNHSIPRVNLDRYVTLCELGLSLPMHHLQSTCGTEYRQCDKPRFCQGQCQCGKPCEVPSNVDQRPIFSRLAWSLLMNKQHLLKLENDLHSRANRVRLRLRSALRDEAMPDEALMEIESLRITVEHIQRAIHELAKDGAQ